VFALEVMAPVSRLSAIARTYRTSFSLVPGLLRLESLREALK